MSIRYFLLILFAAGSFLSAQADGSRYAANSALAEGTWVKIQVDSTGVYKLSHNDLQKMGFPDPGKVSVFGYGGWILDENFSLNTYIDDLPQIPVYRDNDAIFFYGRGPVKWEYNVQEATFVHTNNPYSTAGYYFLTDAATAKSMETITSAGSPQQTISVFDDYLVHENDWVSVSESGRQLFGESFESTQTHSFTYYIPGIVDREGKVAMRFIARPEATSGSVVMSIDEATAISGYVSVIENSKTSSYTKANAFSKTASWTSPKKETVRIKITYGLSRDKNARLDYFRLHSLRELRPYGGSTPFRSIESISKATRFTVKEANRQTIILDVTDALNPKQVEATLNGSELTFSIPAGTLREFVIVQKDRSFTTPKSLGEVKNQNLHALEQTDMVIIVQPALKAQAERLAEYHRENDDLTVEVVEPEQIYNEFSSGMPEATAYRRFLKMFYDRSMPTKETAPQYLLLFGDGIYDNRGVSSSAKSVFQEYGDRMLLTYQSVNSLDMNSYTTDDYFGFLDDNEGRSLASDILDIGIGRLPVRTYTDAKQVVDKLIGYMDNTQFGTWKNNVCFIGDDGSTSDSYTTEHARHANVLADSIETYHPEFAVNKVFLDAYKKTFVGGQTRYPDVNSRIQRLLKDGLLVINYNGHGDTKSWAGERIMTESMINQFSYPYLPLWITASCDFTRFDDLTTSAGELVLLNKTSGGIALFTTTRVVDRNKNFEINQKLNSHLFDKKDGKRLTLGEVMRQSKAGLIGSNKLNFVLIGDPAMRLNYPENKVAVTAINGKPVTGDITLKALEKVTIEGEVRTPQGTKATDFNGILRTTVYDSKSALTTLNNNGVGAFSYTEYQNKLHVGSNEVNNGSFSFTFTVPKDISYTDELAKMVLYAYNEEEGLEAHGAFLNYRVGGTADNPEEDSEGPEIRMLYLNDSTFVSGDKVNVTPLFAARLWDKTGVSITGSSIGHDMMLIIDNKATQSYVLNNYYEPVAGVENEGVVMFSIPELEPGMHTAEFIVWDIQGNSSKLEFSFEVVAGLKPVLIELYATPNPAREQVKFYISHNRPETNMQINLRVYDLTGRLRWTHEETGSSELFKSYIVNWDLNDNSGSRLRPGIYLYQAAVRTNNSKEATKANKMIILAQ
ncbi:type IX secretion system sortase PorU [Parabacteroides sp. OttesenSCG-928-G07]|nr:type IX secretion system sortase PorU [Parabacteroides sp. OttesenSCG-928-G07]